MALGDPIPLVSDDGLILTTWGNAVGAEVNNSVKKTASQVMAGSLQAPSLIIATAQTVSTPANHAARRDWVSTNYLGAAGDTMTGTLSIVPATNQVLKLYTTAVGASANLPYLGFYGSTGVTRLAYIQASTNDLRLISDGPGMLFTTDAVERMRLFGTVLLVGKTGANADNPGVEIHGTGSTALGRINCTVSASNNDNIYLRHTGGADGSGQGFLILTRSAAGTVCGSISQGSGNNSIFNAGAGGSHPTTSDYRLKDDLGAVADPLGRVMQLQPKRLQWKDQPDVAPFDGFIAHEVQTVEPSAVIGAKDAVLPADHPTDPGGVDPQLLDNSKLVPLLTAALQEANARIDALTARLDALEAA